MSWTDRSLLVTYGEALNDSSAGNDPKYRVCFVDQAGDVIGGAEKTLAALVPHLAARYELQAILFEDGGFAGELRAAGVAVTVVPLAAVQGGTREKIGLGAALAVPAAVWRVARTLRRLRPDVVYTHSMKAHVIGAIAARLARVPCVIHLHDRIEGMGLRLLRLAAKIGSQERISCSRAVAVAIGLPRTTAIYGPVELPSLAGMPSRAAARERLGLEQTRPLVAIVGRINRWKGHDRFLRIAARVIAKTPASFAIVGAPVFRDADFVPELEASVAELGLEPYVTFVPWVDDVPTLLRAIDVNVNCSTREPFGRSIVEAAAVETVSVCFDDAGVAETIDDGVNGRVVPAGDEEAAAAAIIGLLDDRPGRRAMEVRARDRADRFSAKLIAAQTAVVLDRAIAERTTARRSRTSSPNSIS